MRHWKIRQWANRPAAIREIEFMCLHCEKASLLSTNAHDLIIAQLDAGVICDVGKSPNTLPDIIQCPHCRRELEVEPPAHVR